MNFFYDFFNLFFKWLRINRDLQENLGETPRCRRGGWTGGEGVGAVERNSEGLGETRKDWDLEKERGEFGGDESVGVVRADRELGKERVVMGAVRAVGTVEGDENKRGCPKSFSWGTYPAIAGFST